MDQEINSGTVYSFSTGYRIAAQDLPKPQGPVSSKMYKVLEGIKSSSYTDSFDWTIYDRIYNRFGNKQPRGGVVFNTTFKLVNYHPQCSKCHYALEIDTYGRGCVHECEYCYAKDQLTLKGYWNNPYPMPVNLAAIRKIFYTVFETSKPSKWRSVLEQRIPARIGSMSDAFMWIDKRFGVTLEFLNILRHYKYPYIIFTRSDLVAEETYLRALDPSLASVQMSICGLNEELTRKIEPAAPSVERRLKALRTLFDNGIWTTVRLNPLFATYPDGYFTDRGSLDRFSGNIPSMRLFDVDKIGELVDSLKESRTPSVVAGFFRLNQNSTHRMSKILGTDLRKFFKPSLYRPRGENRYSDSEVAHYYRLLANQFALSGTRFGTCYIGYKPDHYTRFQNLWSNKADCCDAKGNVSAFSKTSQDISWEIRQQHAPNKEIARISKESEKESSSLPSEGKHSIPKTYFGQIKWEEQSTPSPE